MSEPSIPLVDLKAQYRAIEMEVKSAVHEVFARTDFILGREVQSFEEEFSAFCHAKHAVGCASGTDALYLALRALGIGPGDEVILPAMTFVATALAVTQCGARPVLVDVDPETALIDPEQASRAVTRHTKAIIPVHLYGQCAPMEPLLKLAREHDLRIVEDAAQAHGAIDASGRPAGSIGHAGCFSFYPGKNLGAYGDGGMILTQDDALAAQLRLLRNWGSIKKYHHDVLGLNSRLDTVQAAILRVKLRHLPRWNALRRQWAKAYDESLSGVKGVKLTSYAPGAVFHLYVIRVEERERILKHLIDAGIGASIHYPFAVHELKAYDFLRYAPGSFPVAEAWARRCLSLPIYAELPEGTPQRVAFLLNTCIEGDAR
jgi:dTDP-4-amino-4,6-dideoxygalactose transaminase